ncbi:MAG: hypothetical protein M1541_16705, partial [Acidobacteria bacterium]|nr:hypothetical protein [Acidobacteriota bacterium]
VNAAVNPAGAGTVAGGGLYPQGSTATLTASANPGYQFSSWSGTRGTSTANPLTFQVTRAESIVANYVKVNPSIMASVIGKTGPSNARVWRIRLKNNGTGAASDAQLTGVSFTQTYGAACTPVLGTALPLAYGALAPGGGMAANPITIDFSSCPATARFTVQFTFQANGGTYSGLTNLKNQYQ